MTAPRRTRPAPDALRDDEDAPAPPQGRVTLAEYLAFEEAHPLRHEFIDGYVYAMSGASDPHHRIVSNIHGHLWLAARGGLCRVYAQGFKLRVRRRVFYPDVMVVCEPGGTDDRMAYAPCLLVEVLSRSTALNDRTVKHAAYISLLSLRAYWIVSQEWRSVERHWRGDDGVWRTSLVEGDGALDVPCPARGALTLDELYEGLDLPRTPPGGPPIRRVKEAPLEFAGA